MSVQEKESRGKVAKDEKQKCWGIENRAHIQVRGEIRMGWWVRTGDMNSEECKSRNKEKRKVQIP